MLKTLGRRAAVTAVVVVASAPTAGAAPACHLPGGRTVATGRLAKLIRIPTPDGSALYACIRRTGRKIPLDEDATSARVAGRWAAWQRAGKPGHWRIAVRDLRTGRERLVDGHVAESSLGLTTRGTIVWAQAQDSTSATPLFVNDTLSGGRLLDGGAVDAGSVRLAGRRVSWVSGGEVRSATIR